MEQSLEQVLAGVSFFAITSGGIWEIEFDRETLKAEAEKMLDSGISHLTSVSPEEINRVLKNHIKDLYVGIFHLIVQDSAASEKLDPKGNFKWAPVKKRLAGIKSDLRMLKEYMEAHARRDPKLSFSIGNAATNLEEAASNVNHVLVTHANMAKV